MSRARRRPAISVVGAGRMARALVPSLAAAGYPVRTVLARKAAAARRAARGTGARATTRPEHAVADVAWVLLAVPDRAIRQVAETLAPLADWRGRIVLHHAGALGPEVLRPLREVGAAVGVLHPLQCLGDTDRAGDVLPGSRARIEGDPRAAAAARRLARDLGMVPLRLPARMTPARRAAYHAGAALASNDVVALVGLAVGMLERAGLTRRDALAALLPLVRGTLTRLESGRPRAAISGPAVRGDLATLERHLDQLARLGDAAADIHRLLSAALLDLAESEGLDIPAGVRERLR